MRGISLVVSLSVTLLATVPAMAGTVLHFNKGSVNTQDLVVEQQQLFSAPLAQKAQDYIVQFQNKITEADKQKLKELGVTIFRYMPDDALVVRANLQQVRAVQAQVGVHAVVQYKGEFKLSENLPVMSVFSRNQTVPLLITVFTEQDAKDLLKVLSAQEDVQVLESQDLYIAIRATHEAAHRLVGQVGIEFVQMITPMKAMHMTFDEAVDAETTAAGDYSDLTGYETGTKVMKFDSAWALGFTGKNQSVGFADTGLDCGSTSCLSGDFAPAVTTGFKFGPGAKDWSDPMGHGTHVAGSVAGRGTKSGGKLKGGAFDAKLVPEGMWSPLIENLMVPAKMDQLFESAFKEGAYFHTNSWGSPQNLGVYDSNSQKVDDYMWKNPEMLILFAAGNSGTDKNKDGKIDEGSVSSPGTAKNALTVGASENLEDKGGIQRKVGDLKTAKDSWPAEPIWSSKISDNPNGIAMFSSRGPTKDGRLKPEIVAPGTNILSARSSVPNAEVLWGAYNDAYVWSGGTSMATPLTAGAAAVTRQYLIEKAGVAKPSAALVKATMLHTATDLFPGQYGQGTATQELEHRPDMHQGYGRVNLEALVQGTRSYVDNRAGVTQGASETYNVTVAQGGSLLVNLVYMDAPATPSSSKALVNDLSLSVELNGQLIKAHNDHINNSRIVELKNLAAGSYTIRVKGENIPMGNGGKLPFALVYSAL